MKVISVVRDFQKYNQLVKENPFYKKGTDFICFNNNISNQGISTRYNSFLDGYDYKFEDWFVFCHEDWELKEDLSEKIKDLDKNCLYGPVGAFIDKYGKTCVYGRILQSDKDGQNVIKLGQFVDDLRTVKTFDCQCLIVHSSLIEKNHLRFDEQLLFDLYVEDFCINAFENYQIESKILQIDCQHWSRGSLQPRFFEKYKYLQEKYKDTKNAYISTACSKMCIGGTPLFHAFHSLRRFLYQEKIDKSGCKRIKIFKIEVPFLKFKRKED